MTTLADIKTGDQFLFACQATSVDASGIGLSLYGPGSIKAATAVIGPSGAMTGQLAAAPDQVPVNMVTGFVPVSVGDVLENMKTGETVVCRWTVIKDDGSIFWASSPAHHVVYPAADWSVIGHVNV